MRLSNDRKRALYDAIYNAVQGLRIEFKDDISAVLDSKIARLTHIIWNEQLDVLDTADHRSIPVYRK